MNENFNEKINFIFNLIYNDRLFYFLIKTAKYNISLSTRVLLEANLLGPVEGFKCNLVKYMSFFIKRKN